MSAIGHRFNAAMFGYLASLLSLAFSAGAAFAQVSEREYAALPGWHVDAVFNGPKFGYCGATMANRGYLFRVANDGHVWVMGRDSGPGKIQGRIDLDGQVGTVNFEPLYNDRWVFVRVTDDMLHHLRDSRTITIAIGRERPVRFELDGMDAAMSTVQQCTQRRGVALAQRAQPRTPPPSPGPRSTAAGCPKGERALPETGLCPGEAAEAFLRSTGATKDALPQGCTWVVGETRVVDDVLLYRAMKCGNQIGKLDYAGGAHAATLTSQGVGNQAASVTITMFAGDPSDPYAAINRHARGAIKDPNKRRACYAQDDGQGGVKVDLDPKTVARLSKDGPRDGECGPFGQRDDSSHWQTFGGHAWFVELSQDAWFGIDVRGMNLLEPDKRGDGLKGWRVKY